MKTTAFLAVQRDAHRVVAEIIECPFKIFNKKRTQVKADTVANKNTLNNSLLAMCRQTVGRNLPAASPQPVSNIIQTESRRDVFL